MRKNDIVERVAIDTTYDKCVVENVFDALVETIEAYLKRGEDVHIHSFGTFKITDRKAREARNPRTGEKVHIPAQKAVHFKTSKALNNFINEN